MFQTAFTLALCFMALVLFSVFVYWYISTEHSSTCGECCCKVEYVYNFMEDEGLNISVLNRGPEHYFRDIRNNSAWKSEHWTAEIDMHCSANITDLASRMNNTHLRDLKALWKNTTRFQRCMDYSLWINNTLLPDQTWTGCRVPTGELLERVSGGTLDIDTCFWDASPIPFQGMRKPYPNFKFVFITGQDILLAIMMGVLTVIFELGASIFVSWDNYERQAPKDKALVWKTFSLGWLSQFAWPLLIALVFLPFGPQIRDFLEKTNTLFAPRNPVFLRGGALYYDGNLIPGVLTLDTMLIGPLIISQVITLLVDTYMYRIAACLTACTCVKSISRCCVTACNKAKIGDVGGEVDPIWQYIQMAGDGKYQDGYTQFSRKFSGGYKETCRVVNTYDELYDGAKVAHEKETAADKPKGKKTAHSTTAYDKLDQGELDMSPQARQTSNSSQERSDTWLDDWEEKARERPAAQAVLTEANLPELNLVLDFVDVCTQFQFVTLITVAASPLPSTNSYCRRVSFHRPRPLACCHVGALSYTRHVRRLAGH